MKLYIFCSKPTKKMPKVYKIFCKAGSVLIMQMQIEKIRFKKFLYFRKVPGFNLLECLYKQSLPSVKHLLVKYYLYIQEKNQIWEKDKKKWYLGG